MDDDDPIKRRAAQIRADQIAAAENQTARADGIRDELLLFAQRFLDALTEQTPHPVECVRADNKPYAAVVRFTFLKDGEAWTQNMFELGIDQFDPTQVESRFLYYIVPTSAAFAIPTLGVGVARGLEKAKEKAVQDYAIAIAIEMMARVVASGGVLGKPAEIYAAVDAQERRRKERLRHQKKEYGRKFRTGCGKAILWFFGIAFAIGLLGNLLEACTSK